MAGSVEKEWRTERNASGTEPVSSHFVARRNDSFADTHTHTRVHTSYDSRRVPECVENASKERFRARVFRSLPLLQLRESLLLLLDPSLRFSLLEISLENKIFGGQGTYSLPLLVTSNLLKQSQLSSPRLARPTCGAALTQLRPTSGGTDRHLNCHRL